MAEQIDIIGRPAGSSTSRSPSSTVGSWNSPTRSAGTATSVPVTARPRPGQDVVSLHLRRRRRLGPMGQRPVQPRHRPSRLADRQPNLVLHAVGAHHRPSPQPRGRPVRPIPERRHQQGLGPAMPPRHRPGRRYPVPDRARHHRRSRPAQDQRPRAAARLLATPTTSD